MFWPLHSNFEIPNFGSVSFIFTFGQSGVAIAKVGLWHNMSHAPFTWGNRVDSWLFVVRSQIDNLIPGLSFGHNLCFKCLNGSCEPILDIYVQRTFQWYKKFFNPLGFCPYYHFLKIQKSFGTSIPKVKTPLGVWTFIPSPRPTHSGAWNVILGLPFWLTTLQAFILVVSPKLGLQHI